MKRLVYQVCLGEGRNSKLYAHCIESVSNYCEKHGFHHIVQKSPVLRITPDPFMSNRSKESCSKHGGFLPIFEKEVAFDLLDHYDQIAIIDADIYIREDSPNIFEEFGFDHAFGAVSEREMDCQEWYVSKIKNYSKMQYSPLHDKSLDFKWDEKCGFEFFNMGMILIDSQKFKPYLKGQTAKEFLSRVEFMDFVNGKGTWKWSTDQTLLNYFLKKYDVPVKHMDKKWNGLFTAVKNIRDCHFVHFFLKDKLVDRGENTESLMEQI